VLASFAQTELQQVCTVHREHKCSAEQQAKIKDVRAMSVDELHAGISKLEGEERRVEATFKEEVAKLQAAYQDLVKAQEDGLKAVADGGLSIMRAVRAAQPKCTVTDRASCTSREVEYIEEIQAKDAEYRDEQQARLKRLQATELKPDIAAWVTQRLAILQQLAA
jgi:hypothetical protein